MSRLDLKCELCGSEVYQQNKEIREDGCFYIDALRIEARALELGLDNGLSGHEFVEEVRRLIKEIKGTLP